MSIKKLTALALTTAVMLVVIVSTAIVPALADSGADTRRYRKYNYATGNYTTYNLTVDYDADYSVNVRGIIGGTNEMVESSETAVVRIVYPNGIGATGFIIGKNLIATAAHCVYDEEGLKSFTVQAIDENENVTNYNPLFCHIPTQVDSDHLAYDYALIELDSNVNLLEYGRFYLGLATDEFIKSDAKVENAGFPYMNGISNVRYETTEGELFYRPHDSYADRRLFYDNDTVGGNSGGPVFITETMQSGDVYKTVIGIHTTGEYNDNNIIYNSGIRITSPILKFYMGNPYVNL